jgi:menaquinone-dependent protoporphyrinogen IX oxidase
MSTVAEHITESGHQIKFREIKGLAKTSGYMDQLVIGAIDMKLHLNNMNRE